MSSRIWKFTLAGGEENMFHAQLPVGAKALSADWEVRHFVVWAMFDFANKDKTQKRWFHIPGKGHEILDGNKALIFLNRIDIKIQSEWGDRLDRYHAFDCGWNPAEEKN